MIEGEPHDHLPDIDGHGLPTGPSFFVCDPWGYYEWEPGYRKPLPDEDATRRFIGEDW